MNEMVNPECPYCGKTMDVKEAQGDYSNQPDWYCSCPDEKCAGYISESEGQWHTEADAIVAYLQRPRTELLVQMFFQKLVGKNFELARKCFGEIGYKIFGVEIDGKHSCCTDDINLKLVNVSVENGIIVRVLKIG